MDININITLKDGTTVSHPAFQSEVEAIAFITKYVEVNNAIVTPTEDEEETEDEE